MTNPTTSTQKPATSRPVETPEEREARLEAVRQEFSRDPQYQAATEAAIKLAKAGCDLRVVMGYLRRIAGYKPGNAGRVFTTLTGEQISRKLRGHKRQLEKLAGEIADIRRIRGFMGNMVEANAFHVPEELLDIAVRLSLVPTEGVCEWHPQREAILDLLELVRTSTGRCHYREVATLIEAERVWVELKNKRPIPDIKFDADGLKMILQRHKQRQAREENRRKKLKEALTRHEEAVSAPYSFNDVFGLPDPPAEAAPPPQ